MMLFLKTYCSLRRLEREYFLLGAKIDVKKSLTIHLIDRGATFYLVTQV